MSRSGDLPRIYVRDGCRGGKEQFTWNSLKEQEFKDREQYLGASTKVGMMGKFGRYYVHDWYARKRDTADSIDSERQAVQAYEQELMQEALGQKPKKLLLSKRALSEEELKEFLLGEKSEGKKGRELLGPLNKTVKTRDGQEVNQDDFVQDSMVKGLGYAPHRNAKLEAYKVQAFGSIGELQGSKGAATSSSGGVAEGKPKDEAEVKVEVKREPGEPFVAASETQVKREPGEPFQPVKREPGEPFAPDGFVKRDPAEPFETVKKVPEQPVVKQELGDTPMAAAMTKRRRGDVKDEVERVSREELKEEEAEEEEEDDGRRKKTRKLQERMLTERKLRKAEKKLRKRAKKKKKHKKVAKKAAKQAKRATQREKKREPSDSEDQRETPRKGPDFKVRVGKGRKASDSELRCEKRRKASNPEVWQDNRRKSSDSEARLQKRRKASDSPSSSSGSSSS